MKKLYFTGTNTTSPNYIHLHALPSKVIFVWIICELTLDILLLHFLNDWSTNCRPMVATRNVTICMNLVVYWCGVPLPYHDRLIARTVRWPKPCLVSRSTYRRNSLPWRETDDQLQNFINKSHNHPQYFPIILWFFLIELILLLQCVIPIDVIPL